MVEKTFLLHNWLIEKFWDIIKSCSLFNRTYIKTHKKSGTFLLLTAQIVMHSQLPKRIVKSCSLFYRNYIKTHKKSGTFLLLTAQIVMHWYLYRTTHHCMFGYLNQTRRINYSGLSSYYYLVTLSKGGNFPGWNLPGFFSRFGDLDHAISKNRKKLA